MEKAKRYQELLETVRLYLEGETDPIARMSEIAAIIHEGMGFFWTGFYRVLPKSGSCSGQPGAKAEINHPAVNPSISPENCQLVLGPFQGPPACLRIAYGRGVCGTAWKEQRTIVVPDVEQFPGHIACSSASRSEIVVPVFAKPSTDTRVSRPDSQDRTVTAVLDIDSDHLATFDEEDAKWLERIVSLL